MNLLKVLFGGREKVNGGAALAGPQAVLVELRGDGLPAHVYEHYDISTLEEELATDLDRSQIGELDGHEVSGNGVTLFLYGPDAEVLFSTIESTLRSYPLCEKAAVTIRKGGPGAPERVVLL